jgi:hypothetical protein
MKMSFDVMLYLRIPGVDVARDIQVVIILLDFAPSHHTAVVRDRLLRLPSIYNALDILLARAVLSSILHIAILCVDEEDTLMAILTLLIDDNNGGRNSCPKEDIGRQPDKTFNITLLDDVLANTYYNIASG